MGEQDLTRAIIQALHAKRIWCWRNNSGGTVVKGATKDRFIRLSPAGSPDIMGVIGRGRLFGLEVKIGKGKQSESQIEWQARAIDHGVNYVVVRSIAEALSAVNSWQAIEAARILSI
jgi:hypothetical protein